MSGHEELVEKERYEKIFSKELLEAERGMHFDLLAELHRKHLSHAMH
jgi:hypothetical protein